MIDTKINDARIIPRVEDKEEYVYIEHARIEQDNVSVCVVNKYGTTALPICSLLCLILGPGTIITHRAIQAIADSRCTIIWAGEQMRTFYATGFEKSCSSRNILMQIRHYSDPELHMGVVQKNVSEKIPKY